jgi:hypothetical protein
MSMSKKSQTDGPSLAIKNAKKTKLVGWNASKGALKFKLIGNTI